jgi:glycosyltransferase involved in cell wall biosynthesis
MSKEQRITKIALIISHPIQHFCPQYESFAQVKGVEFKVFFASKLGYKSYYDVNFKKEVSWGNIRLENFNHIFVNGDQVLPASTNLDSANLEKELAMFDPQIVITYGYYQKYQRRARKWANQNRKVVAYISDSENKQHRGQLKEWIKYPYLRWYFSKINYFLTVGDANESFYRRYAVKDQQFIRMHFPVDIKAYQHAWNQKEELQNQVRSDNGIPPDGFVASVVGKLVSWKNQDHIIDAMIQLEKRNLVMYLFVIGSGEMLEQWKQKADQLKKSRVIFTGFVNIENLPAYYAASSVYIHPASIEPHSIAVSEAIYMGCPVIISDRCGSYGQNDDVQVNKNGTVYSFGNIDELANSIEKMMNDKKQIAEWGDFSHTISKKFQERSHKESLEELVKKVTGEKTNI